MTSSFAASLRKLAAEAVEVRRLEEAKAREVEMIARAEELRFKKATEAAARQEVRAVKLQAARKQREKTAEVERIFRQEEATKQAELKRIEAERMRAEMAERLRCEEAERVRLREIRLAQICSDIYGALAVGAWDGVYEVAVDGESFGFKSDLIEMGIAVNRRYKLARLANNALAELLEAVEQLVDTPRALGLFTRLRSMGARLQKSGQFALVSQFSKLADQIYSNLANERDRLELTHFKLLDDIAGKEESIALVESEIRRTNPLLAEETKGDARRNKQFKAVAEKIKTHVDDIGSSYQAHLPLGIEPYKLPFETKAAALRLAYGTFIHGTDFDTFSVLEIINLMRLANGSPLIETLEPDDVINSGYFRQVDSAFATLAKRRKRMIVDLAFANESLSPMRHAARQVAANIESAKASLAKATFFQTKCMQFEQVAARALEGVDASQLRFDGDQYVGPTIACLAVEHPVANAHLELAYQELRWLASEDGRDFAGYLDIVLSELAKEGARSVGVTFIESLSENKIEVGKVVLVCNIGSDLMNLLFSKRGIGVDVISVSDGRTVFQLNW